MQPTRTEIPVLRGISTFQRVHWNKDRRVMGFQLQPDLDLPLWNPFPQYSLNPMGLFEIPEWLLLHSSLVLVMEVATLRRTESLEKPRKCGWGLCKRVGGCFKKEWSAIWSLIQYSLEFVKREGVLLRIESVCYLVAFRSDHRVAVDPECSENSRRNLVFR